MNLKGKTAIVTGGGRDIGRACVMRLAEAGAQVAINYHQSSEGADSAVKEIVAAGGQAFAMQGDMTKAADVQAFVDRAVAEYGKIDIVMPIAGGIIARKTIPEMTLEHWQAVMDLNATSTFLVIKAALQHIPEGGAIINMSSQAGRDGGGGGAVAYGASKGAVLTMTRGLAKELGPKIRVNALCPGMIDTDFHNIFTKPEVRKHVAGITPLKREGTSEDVANLASISRRISRLSSPAPASTSMAACSLAECSKSEEDLQNDRVSSCRDRRKRLKTNPGRPS